MAKGILVILMNDNYKYKKLLEYIGIPILCIAFIMVRDHKESILLLLLGEIIIVFGYVAAREDLKIKKIPNELILAMLGTWIIVIVFSLFIDIESTLSIIKDSVIGFTFGGGLFLFVYIISNKKLGGGDVKFMAITGLYLGFTGIFSAMLYGTTFAALTGIVLLLMKKIGRKDTMPLAPFLYIGILITVFYG